MTGEVLDFQEIYEKYRPRVQGYLARLLDRSEVEDLTQEVFIKVEQALPGFRGDSSLSTWIYRIATNAANARLRSPSYRIRKLNSPKTDERLNQQVIVIPSIEVQLVRKEMNECIRSIVDKLPGNYRTVIVLSEMEGFKNREISEILGISLDTVKIRLHRARAKLKREMSQQCNFYRDERNELACDAKTPNK